MPPDCAKSFLPPPPFPFEIEDAYFAISSAPIKSVKFSVTPTTKLSFSSFLEHRTTMPLFC